MKDRILRARRGDRLLLLGNEAIVRGALEAGLQVATTYPGTPASEIGDTFNQICAQAGIHFEYSINEKVAFEVAQGASLGGGRSLCSMKHLGLNVAGDPFVTSAYVGAVGGFVIVSAGEPGCHTSPNEQDHRLFARMAYVPLFDPSDAQEALEMTRLAFDLSERWQLPVLLRPTTRLSHTQGIVTVGDIDRGRSQAGFVRDQARFVPIPRHARVLRRWLIERIDTAARDADCNRFNYVVGSGQELAIVTSGVSYCYVSDAVRALGLQKRVRILKLGIPYPVSTAFVLSAIGGVDRILVLEELEPFIEDIVKRTLFDAGRQIPVSGKESGAVPLAGELTPRIVREAIRSKLSLRRAGAAPSAVDEPAPRAEPIEGLPLRPPILCPGCPHRASFFALKLLAGPDDIVTNDIGCYTLGMNPPFNMGDVLLCMGASITSGSGLSRATGRKVLAFIGDSTFFHSGTTGLANAVVNQHDLLVVVLDNRVTAMTGHQPSPSDLASARGTDEVSSLSLEEMARACGVEQVAVVDPLQVDETHRKIRELYHSTGVRVVISQHPCPLFVGKGKDPQKRQRRAYRVDGTRCRTCAQSSGDAVCGLLPSNGYCRTRTLKRVEAGPGFRPSEYKPPCSAACPAGLCIQGFIAFAQDGELSSAYQVIRRSLPLASVLSRVCPRPCELACARVGHDEAVAINDIKRFVLDAVPHDEQGSFTCSLLGGVEHHGRRVAVVGSGPAGLAATWELYSRGYDVTILEKEQEVGGLLRWGIPRFRLPGDVLQRDIDEITSSVQLRCGTQLGRDFATDDLFAEGFEAVFLGLGATVGSMPEVAGRGAEGVTDALAFLRAVASGELKELGGTVVVVGGGDAALDAARTALRLGAEQTTILYRRTREEMPAHGAEVGDAEQEGVQLLFQTLPSEIVSVAGRVTSVVVRRTRPGEPDASGRRRPIEVVGSEFEVRADHVIFAIGQKTGREVAALFGASDGSFLRVDPVTMMTDKPGVFAGGDVVSGPATVVDAVAAGKRAAWGIDCMLRKEAAAPLDPGLEYARPQTSAANLSGTPRMARLDRPVLPAEQRVRCFDEVHRPLGVDETLREVQRCLACGSCALCNACVSVLGCNAFFLDADAKMQIDEKLCNGCGLCVQVCPNGAIHEVPYHEAQTGPAERPAAAGPMVGVFASESFDGKAVRCLDTLRLHLAGVGGQGTLSASGIVGEAAMNEGLNVVIGALHGMAQRGGMVMNQLVIGDAKSPIIDSGEADIVAGFEPIETLRSLHYGKPGCVVFMNTSRIVPFTLTVQGRSYPDVQALVETIRQRASLVLTVDAVRLAAEAGNSKAVSPVMLGFMAKTSLLPFGADRLRQTLAELSPPRRREVSLRAFDAGASVAPLL